MPIDIAKIQALLERADPSMKLKRLEKELDGDESQIGLREQLMVAVQNLSNQNKLLAQREEQRDRVDDLALDSFEKNIAEVRMLQIFYEGQVDLLAEKIEEIEGEVDTLKKAGTGASNGNRRARRGK